MTVNMELMYRYVMTGVQVFLGLDLFFRFLHRKRKFYYYLLFGGWSVWAICFLSDAVLLDLGIFILSLAAMGIFVFHTDWKTAALYAVLTVEIMQLCYGIVNSLMSILYPYLSAFDQKTEIGRAHV